MIDSSTVNEYLQDTWYSTVGTCLWEMQQGKIFIEFEDGSNCLAWVRKDWDWGEDADESELTYVTSTADGWEQDVDFWDSLKWKYIEE